MDQARADAFVDLLLGNATVTTVVNLMVPVETLTTERRRSPGSTTCSTGSTTQPTQPRAPGGPSPASAEPAGRADPAADRADPAHLEDPADPEDPAAVRGVTQPTEPTRPIWGTQPTERSQPAHHGRTQARTQSIWGTRRPADRPDPADGPSRVTRSGPPDDRVDPAGPDGQVGPGEVGEQDEPGLAAAARPRRLWSSRDRAGTDDFGQPTPDRHRFVEPSWTQICAMGFEVPGVGVIPGNVVAAITDRFDTHIRRVLLDARTGVVADTGTAVYRPSAAIRRHVELRERDLPVPRLRQTGRPVRATTSSPGRRDPPRPATCRRSASTTIEPSTRADGP